MGIHFVGRYERLFGKLKHGWKDTPGRRESFVTKCFQIKVKVKVKVKVKQSLYKLGRS